MRSVRWTALLAALGTSMVTWRTLCAQSATATSAQTVSSSARCFAANFQTELRNAVAGYANVAGIPGVSFGIVAKDTLIVADGIGYANKSLRTRATANTPYNIASVTKVFTATLAMQLVAEGKLDLDAPVSRYLPDTVRMPVDSSGVMITARHLLTHTSGLRKDPPNRRNQPVAGPVDPGVADAYNIEDLYRALAVTKLRTRPGTEMFYSNYGFALLGHVVERIAREPYETVLRARLLTPLGMTSSGITLTPAQSKSLAAFYWDQYDERVEQAVHARFGTVAGHIGLTSTVRDLSQFLIAHLGTTAPGRAAISSEVARRMFQPQVQLDSTNRTHRVDMAFSWFREVALDASPKPAGVSAPLYWHYGDVDGHASAVFLQPQNGLGVIVLQNLAGDVGALATEQIGRFLVQRASAEMARCKR